MGARKRLRAEALKEEKKVNRNCTIKKIRLYLQEK
jgi:hypothetical protein